MIRTGCRSGGGFRDVGITRRYLTVNSRLLAWEIYCKYRICNDDEIAKKSTDCGQPGLPE